ncbi:MAG: FkbM family methyltransferase [Bacteroidota bacterium]|nr:FkbM family methyltransferase [Bacteroidota bacterium]
MNIKGILRSTLNLLHLDLTKNLEYDRLTKLIMKRVISNKSNCIDVGCHKGEILDSILELSPKGKHFGFEPIPLFFNQLEIKYSNKASIYSCALSDKSGTSTFQFVKNAPAYSGINKRKYDVQLPDIEEIQVELKTLDEIISHETKIDFIKIDVEGAEFNVLKGAKELLKKSKPIVIFESGLGASDYYGTNPIDLYNFITKDIGLKISLLKSFVNNEKSLTALEYESHFNTNKEYYFIAHT